MGTFKQFLVEIKTNVVYENDWLINVEGGSIRTFLHVDDTTNDVVINSEQFEIMSHDYQVQLNKKPNKKYNIYEFYFMTEHGDIKQTNKAESYKYSVFGAIEDLFERMVNLIPKDSVVVFWAYTTEPVRVKIYDKLFRKIELKYPNILTDVIINSFIKHDKTRKYYGFCKDNITYDKLKKDNIFWSNFINLIIKK